MAHSFGVSEDAIVAAARAKVAGWGADPPEGFSLAPLTGGMSNLMFTVTRAATGERAVARLLSPALDAVIDRHREMRIVRYLATSGIGPRLWGTYAVRPPVDGGGGGGAPPAAGTPTATLVSSPAAATPRTSAAAARGVMLRFEEFVDGRTLAVEDLRGDAGVRAAMASKLAALHAQRPDLREAEERRRLRGASSGSDCSLADLPPPLQPVADLRPSLARFLQLTSAIARHPRVAGGRVPPALAELLRGPGGLDWAAEVAWLARAMERHGGPTVLCHGDAQPGNWILAREAGGGGSGGGGGELYLIDYEYSRYDHRGFDTGNQFCECTFDYSHPAHPGYTLTRGHYPSLAWQADFLGHYAAAAARTAAGGEGGGDVTAEPTPARHAPPAGGGAAQGAPAPALDSEWARTTCSAAALAAQFPGRPDLQALAREGRLGLLASHLYWALWSAVMGAGKQGITLPAPGEPAPPPAAAQGGGGGGAGGGEDDGSATASGHSLFDYNVYGLERLGEYVRLKAQLAADVPEWAA